MNLENAIYCHIKPTLFYMICFGPYYFRKPMLLMLLTMRAIIYCNRNDRVNTWLMCIFFLYIDHILKSDILYVIYPVLYSQSQNVNEGVIVGILSYASPISLAVIPYYHLKTDTDYLNVKDEINTFIESSLIAGMGFINTNNIDIND